MARAGIAKTRLENGQRIDVQTGQVFGQPQPNTLTQTAQNAGVTLPQVEPSIDVTQIDQPQQTPSTITPTRQQAVESQALIPSAVADDTGLTEQEDVLAQRIKSLSGRSETESRLTEEAGIPEIESEIRDIGAQISRRRADLTAELEQIGQQGFRATAVRGQEARGRRQVAAEIAGLEAAQQAAQGQLATAVSSVERAVSAKYDPILEDIQIQRELISLSKDRMTRQERKLAEQRETALMRDERLYESQKRSEERAFNLVLDAQKNGLSPQVASRLMAGVASGQMGVSDVLESAGSYVGLLERQAAQRAADRASIANRTDLINLAQEGDQFAIEQLGYDPNDQALSAEDMVSNELRYVQNVENRDRVQGLIDNTVGIETTSGIVKAPWLSGIFSSPFSANKDTSLIGKVGRFLPPVAMVQNVSARDDFLADASYVIKNLTLEKFLELKAQGATFGAMSEEEWRVIGSSASELSAMAIEENGVLKGFRGSEEKVAQELQEIYDTYQTVIDRENMAALSAQDKNEITNIYNGN